VLGVILPNVFLCRRNGLHAKSPRQMNRVLGTFAILRTGVVGDPDQRHIAQKASVQGMYTCFVSTSICVTEQFIAPQARS
jgi:hypothetical protein